MVQRLFPVPLLPVKTHQLVIQHQLAPKIPVLLRLRQPVEQMALRRSPVAPVLILPQPVQNPAQRHRLRPLLLSRFPAQYAGRLHIVFPFQAHSAPDAPLFILFRISI